MKKYAAILLCVMHINAMNNALVESEDEFISRIKNDKIPRTFTDGDLFAWCPHETKTALLEFLPTRKPTAVLKIAKKDVIYTTLLEPLSYKRIAMSPQADLMAFSYLSKNDNVILEVRSIQLKKKNENKGVIIVGENKQELSSRLPLIPYIFAFNKQGTHFIAWESDQLFMTLKVKNNQVQIESK